MLEQRLLLPLQPFELPTNWRSWPLTTGNLNNKHLMTMITHKRVAQFAAMLSVVAFSTSANATSVAVLGDNAIDDYINSLGGSYSATLVSDAQVATPGFLSSFDVFLMTRNGFSFGSGLSAGAASEAMSYVGPSGNVVLLNADFADSIPGDATIAALLKNSIDYAASSGNGFVGEFNGAVSGLTANGNGFSPLGFIAGTAGALGLGAGGSGGALYKTPVGAGHTVTSFLSDGYNPGAVEFGATISGAAAINVLATFGEGGNPAVLVREGVRGVPDAGSTFALLPLAFGALCFYRRQK